MILTVTLNAALDVTYATSAVEWGGSNRVGTVRERAGGKGVNVARVAAALGSRVLATGLLGGDTGDLVRADLDRSGIAHAFVPLAAPSRRTLTVVEPGAATVFNEPGPRVTPAEWRAFLGHFRSLTPDATVVTLSGSLPPGLPPDAYATLIASVAPATPVILDADGEALARGVTGAPALVKPNADELERATGKSSPAEGAEALRTSGAQSVLVSLGPEGMLAVTPDGCWHAVPPEPVTGNPTGAGDAAVAAAALSLAARAPWPDLLRDAVALSAAAVRAPVAGDFDPALYDQLRTRTPVHALTP